MTNRYSSYNWQGTGKAFPVPPVCTAYWTAQDWQRYEDLHGVETEPETINSSFGVWRKTGQTDEKGHALYHLEEPA